MFFVDFRLPNWFFFKHREAEDERAQRAMLKEAWGIQNRCSKIQTTIDGFDMKQVEENKCYQNQENRAKIMRFH